MLQRQRQHLVLLLLLHQLLVLLLKLLLLHLDLLLHLLLLQLLLLLFQLPLLLLQGLRCPRPRPRWIRGGCRHRGNGHQGRHRCAAWLRRHLDRRVWKLRGVQGSDLLFGVGEVALGPQGTMAHL